MRLDKELYTKIIADIDQHQIQELDLSKVDTRDLNEFVLQQLALSIRNNKSLRTIKFPEPFFAAANLEMSDFNARLWGLAILHHPTLTAISMRNVELSEEGLQYFRNALAGNPNVTTFQAPDNASPILREEIKLLIDLNSFRKTHENHHELFILEKQKVSKDMILRARFPQLKCLEIFMGRQHFTDACNHALKHSAHIYEQYVERGAMSVGENLIKNAYLDLFCDENEKSILIKSKRETEPGPDTNSLVDGLETILYIRKYTFSLQDRARLKAENSSEDPFDQDLVSGLIELMKEVKTIELKKKEEAETAQLINARKCNL